MVYRYTEIVVDSADESTGILAVKRRVDARLSCGACDPYPEVARKRQYDHVVSDRVDAQHHDRVRSFADVTVIPSLERDAKPLPTWFKPPPRASATITEATIKVIDFSLAS